MKRSEMYNRKTDFVLQKEKNATRVGISRKYCTLKYVAEIIEQAGQLTFE